MSEGVVKFTYHEYRGEWKAVEEDVIEEGFVSIFVNGQELATVMCSPREQDRLALGFLCNEGIITSLDDVRAVQVCPSGACVDVWLKRADFVRPQRLILTSGCGGGVTFDDLSEAVEPLNSQVTISPGRLSELMIEMQRRGTLYARSRGVHTSALSDGERLIALAEDVGRHNTIDKLRGACLIEKIDPHGMILLCTGRISSEMINKAARMGCPIVASRTSPTSMSVQLAREWNLTLVGYARRDSMNVYAHAERLRDEGGGRK
ncbi:MAG TPA: formate dehydrogenase accessory sulfurtransferase FdhD [Anaerolineae bacterium]